MTKREKPAPWESAARGALAGLAGGAALTIAHRWALPRLPDRTRPRVQRWDRMIQTSAEQMGFNVTPSTRTAVGVVTQLLAAMALGAVYTVLAEQSEPSQHGEQLLDAALVYGASQLAPELAKRRRPLRRRKRARLQTKLLERVTAPAIFGQATSLALKAMPR